MRGSEGDELRRGATRLVLPVTLACTITAVPIQLGWIPYFRYAWGCNLWQYLPLALAYALAAATLLLAWPAWRTLLLRAAAAFFGHLGTRRKLIWVAALGASLVLWLLRERLFLGDTKIILFTLIMEDWEFFFPDIGATFLLRQGFRAGSHLWPGGEPWPGGGPLGAQAMVCAFGGLAVLCFARLGRALAPNPRQAWIATLLIASGGIVRIFAGHVEVYAFVLVCGATYLWTALSFLRGQRGWIIPSLALGTGLWLHLQFICLLPAHLLLFRLRDPGAPLRALLGKWALALALVAAPTLLFFAAILATGHLGDLVGAWEKMIEWTNLDTQPGSQGVWIRFWTSPPGPGTGYVMLSWPHLKYLANALVLLAPAAIPLLACFSLASPRRFLATPEAIFLSSASVVMVFYALLVRPVWGPYDWDLFSLTALCLTSLAALLLANGADDPRLAHAATVLVSATALLFTIPYLIIGIAPARDAGPFYSDATKGLPDESFVEAFERQIVPWL